MHGKSTRNINEKKLCKDLDVESSETLWIKTYKQKLKFIKIPKLKEFNFKLLHNIVPTGKLLSKWRSEISEKCDVCDEIEDVKHMLFSCQRVRDIWRIISNQIGHDIGWKELIIGFEKKDESELNHVFSIVLYSIFKENSHCKYELSSFKDVDLKKSVEQNLAMYRKILENSIELHHNITML